MAGVEVMDTEAWTADESGKLGATNHKLMETLVLYFRASEFCALRFLKVAAQDK